MAEPEPKPRIRPPLRVISEEGELQGTCPTCQDLADQVDGAQKEIRSWRASYAVLKRDKDSEARGHELWPKGLKLFRLWQERTNHTRSKWTGERFFLCLPYLQEDEANGTDFCRDAVAGIAYDPNTKVARNGMLERFDSWELLFRNRATFERYVNRAPHHLPKPEHVKALADALLFLNPEWEPQQAVAEAQRRLT